MNFSFCTRRESELPPWARTSGLSALLGAFFLLAACDLADGFNDMGKALVDSDKSLLDKPGRQLAAGDYSNVSVDGSLDEGARVLAFHNGSVKKLAFVPFLEGETGCEVGPAVAFSKLSSRVDFTLSPLVAYLETQDAQGRGRLHFVNYKCEEVLSPLSNSSLPTLVFPGSEPRGVLSLQSNGDLLFIDAETPAMSTVASPVSSGLVVGDYLLTLESGELVTRDSDFKEVRRQGQGVTQFDAYKTDNGLLITWTGEGGAYAQLEDAKPRQLAADGCATLIMAPTVIALYSPCNERKLLLEVQGSSIGASSPFVYLSGQANTLELSSVQLSLRSTGESTVLWQTSTDSKPVATTLSLGRVTGSSLGTLSQVKLGTQKLTEQGRLVGGEIYDNWDGSIGTLSSLSSTGSGSSKTYKLQELSSKVAQVNGGSSFSALGLIDHYDSDKGLGEWTRLTQDQSGKVSRQKLASKVPQQYIPTDSDGTAAVAIAEPNGDFGKVFFNLFAGKVTQIGQNARLNSLRFLEQPKSVLWFGKSNAQTGYRLEAYLVDSGLEMSLHDQVTEFRPVPWPAPGVLYVVGAGSDAGIWYSKAR